MAIVGVIVMAAVHLLATGAKGEREQAADLMFDTVIGVTEYSSWDFPVVDYLHSYFYFGRHSFSEVTAYSNGSVHLTDIYSVYEAGLLISPYEVYGSVRFTVRTGFLDANVSTQAERIISYGFSDASHLNTVYVATFEEVHVQVHAHVYTIAQYIRMPLY